MLQSGSEEQSHTTMAGFFVLQTAKLYTQPTRRLCGEVAWSWQPAGQQHPYRGSDSTWLVMWAKTAEKFGHFRAWEGLCQGF